MTIFRKNNIAQISTSTNGLPEFVLTDRTVDRYRDIVEPTGLDLTHFRNNPIALFNHNPDFPIGKWVNPRLINGQLRAHLKMARGSSARIDELVALVDAELLNAVSIGFLPEEIEPMNNGGTRYTRATLVEASLVSIPANPNALAVAKKMKISEATMHIVFKRTSDGATLAERQQRAREVLARARAVIAKVDAYEAKRRTTSRTTPLTRLSDEISYDGLTAHEIATLEIARAKASQQCLADRYAHNKSNSFDDTPPDVFFNGRPMFAKKNKFGW